MGGHCDWEFYIVDLHGELGHWIECATADAGRGAVWYVIMTDDNCGVLNGLPDIDFFRGALKGLKVEGTMVRLMRCVAPDLTEFFRKWAAWGPPREAEGRIPQLEVETVVKHGFELCVAMNAYTAEAEGYLTVDRGECLEALVAEPQPGDIGCRWKTYVYGRRQGRSGDAGWSPHCVMWRR